MLNSVTLIMSVGLSRCNAAISNLAVYMSVPVEEGNRLGPDHFPTILRIGADDTAFLNTLHALPLAVTDSVKNDWSQKLQVCSQMDRSPTPRRAELVCTTLVSGRVGPKLRGLFG
ncbi:hypothetical protein GGR53DRAFT_243159 [Hypoxylon sp. FL1150]|nr:hypothetical protein GGR53DRAFT_243159 [Hypoxylon sp. FL1150]